MIALNIVLGIFFYVIVNITIKGLVWMIFKKEFKYKIHLPKKKEFTTGKVSPIYQLEESGYGGFNILKYEIRYDEDQKWWGMLGGILIPLITLNVQVYKYHQCFMLHYSCKKGGMLELIGNLDLCNFYEREYKKLKDQLDAEQRIIDEKQFKIDQLNKIFNENYEN